jgi:glycosyltransferase involved in cell wall biosynthesis
MACGLPVIVSDVSSIPEIADDAAKLINPLDSKEISEAMLELAKSEDLRRAYREKGQTQARKFDWEKCARETLEVYKSLK